MVNRIRKRRRRRHGSRKRRFLWDARDGIRRRSGDKNRRWNRIIYGVSAAIVFVVISIGVVWHLRRDHLVEMTQEIRTERHATHLTQVSAAPTAPEARSEAAIAELLGFVNDPTHAARSKRMHGQADALEHLEDYYDRRGNALPRKIINPSVSAINFKDRELLLVAFLDENGRPWSAPFEWDGSSYRLHWEAMTGFGDVSWSRFFEKRPKGPFKMRANIFLPQNETFDPVATDHVVVLISHPDLTRSTSVLVRNKSEVHRQLSEFNRATDIPGFVEIQWPDEEAGRLPVLTRWYHRDWLH